MIKQSLQVTALVAAYIILNTSTPVLAARNECDLGNAECLKKCIPDNFTLACTQACEKGLKDCFCTKTLGSDESAGFLKEYLGCK